MIKLHYNDEGTVEVHFFDKGNNPCLHIENSHVIKEASAIWAALEYIHKTDEYQALVDAGYMRTMTSEYHEWVGHNVLYRLGFMKTRTGSVDIDNNEPYWRRVVYAFLSIFGR